MKRRVLAVFLSLVLAAVGGFLVLSYAANSDRRAMRDMQPVDVLVATKPITKGTSTDDIAEAVAVRPLPAIALVPGVVTSMEQIAGRVAAVDIQAGEQLAGSRFVDRETLTGSPVSVPAGMQQISIKLDSQRVMGGELKAGASVGVFLSVGDKPNGVTHLALHKMLVTRLQGGVAAPEGGDSSGSTPADSSLMVTLATTANNAERIVFAAEYGSIWLSSEPADAAVSGTRPITQKNLYQ